MSQSFTVPEVARRIGTHEKAVREAVDKIGGAQRVGRLRVIPAAMIPRIAKALGIEFKPVSEIRTDMVNLRVGVRGDGKTIVARLPDTTTAYDIERTKTAFASGDVSKALEVLGELDGEIAFINPEQITRVNP